MERDFNNLADTYLREHETKSDEEFWAFEEVSEILRSGDLELALADHTAALEEGTG